MLRKVAQFYRRLYSWGKFVPLTMQSSFKILRLSSNVFAGLVVNRLYNGKLTNFKVLFAAVSMDISLLGSI